jgi:hypothetical protein
MKVIFLWASWKSRDLIPSNELIRNYIPKLSEVGSDDVSPDVKAPLLVLRCMWRDNQLVAPIEQLWRGLGPDDDLQLYFRATVDGERELIDANILA